MIIIIILRFGGNEHIPRQNSSHLKCQIIGFKYRLKYILREEMKFLPVLFGILVAESGIADFENGVWTSAYATSDNQDGFFVLKRLQTFLL